MSKHVWHLYAQTCYTATKTIRCDLHKNEELKRERGISFVDLLQARLLHEKWSHPNRPHQSVMLFELEGYIWVVPYVETETEIFLKTLYPSRKFTRLYYEGGFDRGDRVEKNQAD